MGDMRGAYRVLVGRPEGKRPLGRDRHSSMGNIKLDLQELGLRGTGLIWLRTRTDGRCLCMYQ
jgi:hypothetical protein